MMHDVLQIIALVVKNTYDDDDSAAAYDQITKILRETDTPFLDDQTFDPFINLILPALIENAVQQRADHTQSRKPWSWRSLLRSCRT